MKKVYIYALAYALTAVSCQDNDWVADNATSQVPEIEIPMGAADGELLIKFVPEMSDILNQTLTRAGGGIYPFGYSFYRRGTQHSGCLSL